MKEDHYWLLLNSLGGSSNLIFFLPAQRSFLPPDLNQILIISSWRSHPLRVVRRKLFHSVRMVPRFKAQALLPYLWRIFSLWLLMPKIVPCDRNLINLVLKRRLLPYAWCQHIGDLQELSSISLNSAMYFHSAARLENRLCLSSDSIPRFTISFS